MFDSPRGIRRYNIGAHLFGSRGLGGSGVGAGVTTWRQAIGMRPSSNSEIARPITTPYRIGRTPTPTGPLDTHPSTPTNVRLITLKNAPDDADGGTGGSGGSGGKTDFQTLADAFSHGLSMQPVSTQDATPTVITDPNSGTGSGMNIKTILIVLALGAAAWFAWKKWGKKAVATAAA